MTVKFFGEDNTHKTFVLSIGDSKNISFEENDLLLRRKNLFLFISNSNRDFMIVNKDKEVLFFKFALELKSALEEYISEKKDCIRYKKH